MLRDLVIATNRLLAATSGGVRVKLPGEYAVASALEVRRLSAGSRNIEAILAVLTQSLRSFFPALAQEHRPLTHLRYIPLQPGRGGS